jgi:parvulin-like peptidyl-prolyl isomerase
MNTLMRISALVCVLVLLTAGCVKSAEEPTTEPDNDGQPTEESPDERIDPVEQLLKDIAEVAARDEKDVTDIQVQHLLIAHVGAGIDGVSRSLAEAEKLTAEIWQQIKDGADFDELIKEHTNDSPPGIYGMTTQGPGDRGQMIFARSGMVPAFGNVGWRLEVGEYGVAPYHQRESPYGFHIIKRLR